MINYEDQLKLQAYLDGELPEAEARQVDGWLARDPEAAGLLIELRQTRDTLAGVETECRLPESREFYWSKIQRQINLEQASGDRIAQPEPLLLRLRRLLVPLTGVALVVVAALISTRGARHQVPAVETSLADSGAMIYHDFSAGATFVWLSYPADQEMAEGDDLDGFD